MSPADVKLLFEGFGALILLVAGSLLVLTVARAWSNRVSAAAARRPEIDDDRLRHLEQAVDAIAVEVERISEAQRFSAKLLAGREAAATTSAAEQAERALVGAPRLGATAKSD